MKPGRSTITYSPTPTAVTYLIQTGRSPQKESNYVIKIFIFVLQMKQIERRQDAALRREQITTGSPALNRINYSVCQDVMVHLSAQYTKQCKNNFIYGRGKHITSKCTAWQNYSWVRLLRIRYNWLRYNGIFTFKSNVWSNMLINKEWIDKVQYKVTCWVQEEIELSLYECMI